MCEGFQGLELQACQALSRDQPGVLGLHMWGPGFLLCCFLDNVTWTSARISFTIQLNIFTLVCTIHLSREEPLSLFSMLH